MTSSALQDSTQLPYISSVPLLIPPITPRILRTEAPIKTYRTPQRRSNGSSVSSAARRKLGIVAPLPGRCLITGSPEPFEICHVLPKATSIVRLARLERSWDPRNCDEETSDIPHGLGEKDHFYINLNTTRNLIYLNPSMHTTFDQGGWALLPASNILNDIVLRSYTGLSAGYHLYPEGQEYTFTFVPLNYKLAFLQFGLDGNPVASHLHPFTSLAPVHSHVHPYFVICNTGEKAKLLGDTLKNLPISHSQRAALLACRKLYESWIEPKSKKTSPNPSRDSFLSPPAPKPEPDSTSASSGPHTTLESRGPRRRTHSQARGENTPPTSDGRGYTRRCAIVSPPLADTLPMPKEIHCAETSSILSGDTVDIFCDYTTRTQDWVTAMVHQWNLVNPDAHEGDPDLNLYSLECSRSLMPGSWLNWTPDWTLSQTLRLYNETSPSHFGSRDHLGESGRRYNMRSIGRASSIC